MNWTDSDSEYWISIIYLDSKHAKRLFYSCYLLYLMIKAQPVQTPSLAYVCLLIQHIWKHVMASLFVGQTRKHIRDARISVIYKIVSSGRLCVCMQAHGRAWALKKINIMLSHTHIKTHKHTYTRTCTRTGIHAHTHVSINNHKWMQVLLGLRPCHVKSLVLTVWEYYGL